MSLFPDQIEQIFSNADKAVAGLQSPSPAVRKQKLQTLLRQVNLLTDRLQIEVGTDALLVGIAQPGSDSADDRNPARVHCIELPIALRRRGVERRIIVNGDGGSPSSNPDPVLVGLIAKAHGYLNRLTRGEDISASDLAAEEKLDGSDLSRILRLAFLAPDITGAILDGTQPVELTATWLMRLGEIPYRWGDQRKALGFETSTAM
ncbi:MAG: hypothetical protein WAU86_18190 [Oricola sp.]